MSKEEEGGLKIFMASKEYGNKLKIE